MPDSGPDYGLEALRAATAARTSTPEGADPNAMAASGYQIPGLDFSFSSPSFLSARSRWVLFLVLGAGGFFALWLAFQMTVTAPADADPARHAPAFMALFVALLAFVLSYLTVMGFGSVEIKTTIGQSAGTGAGEGQGLTVTDTVPPANATATGRNVEIEATFSAAVDRATVTGSTFTLKKATGGAAVPATVTADADGKTARLKPSANLEANTKYEARITKGVKTAAGKALAADKVWSFTTGA